MQTCSSGSSGSVPSARIQTRAGSSVAGPRPSDHGGALDVAHVERPRALAEPGRAPADAASASRSGSVVRRRHAGGGGLGVLAAPSCGSWNDADREKIGSPCWIASTRRVVNERPSRTRSAS